MKLFSNRNTSHAVRHKGTPCKHTMSQYSLLTDEAVRDESGNLLIHSPSTRPVCSDHLGNPTFARGTVFDPRFGAQNEGEICPTCSKGQGECPGHMGCVQLECPMMLWDSNGASQICSSLVAFLSNTCAHCGIVTTKAKECRLCQRKVKRVTFCQSDATSNIAAPAGFVDEALIEYTAVVMQPKRMGVHDMKHLAAAIYQQLKGDESEIIESCLNRFGCSDPRALFYNTIAVPPPAHRLDKTSSWDPLGPYTRALLNVVKTNCRLRQLYALRAYAQSATQEEREILVKNAQADGTVPSSAFAEVTKPAALAIDVTTTEKELRIRAFALHNVCPGSTFKGCWGVMTGTTEASKESAFRQDIMGKRITNVARSVIRGDATLALDEVGVPLEFARRLEVQTPVTPPLASKLRSEIESGQWGTSDRDWRRIRQVSLDANVECKLDVSMAVPLSRAECDQLCELLYELERGIQSTKYLLLHRGLVDGDTVLANRNPSLHRANMQALRVRIFRGEGLQNTIAFNPEQASLFQLDFDGDMMMLAVPGDTWALAEARVLHNTATLLVNANGSLLHRPGPNTVLGLYDLTNPLWSGQPVAAALSVFDRLFESIDHEQIMTLHQGHASAQLAERARQRITTSDVPQQQAIAELVALCLPAGLDLQIAGCANVGGWRTNEAAARGTVWTACGQVEASCPRRVWERFRAAGALSVTIALTTNGAISHGHTEWVDAESAAMAVADPQWVGILTWQKPAPLHVNKNCKNYSIYFGNSAFQSETVPLVVQKGQVERPVPRLTRTLLTKLLDKLYRYTLDADVVMASARTLQSIGNAYLTLGAPCCSPADIGEAARNKLPPSDCTLLPLGAAWGMQYHHSDRELAMSGDALRAPVLSGAKGSLRDLRCMIGNIGSIRAGFLGEADKITDNFLHGLTTTTYMQSQRVGVYQDLKTKTEIGNLGYIYKQLTLLCSKAVVGCRSEVVMHHQGRVRLVQPSYNGDALDPHRLAGSSCMLNSLTSQAAVQHQYHRALRCLHKGQKPREMLQGRMCLLFPMASTTALVDQIEQTATAVEVCALLGESLGAFCPDFWSPILEWWLHRVTTDLLPTMVSVPAVALVVLACFDALVDWSTSNHIIPWQHMWTIAQNPDVATPSSSKHGDSSIHQLVGEHAKRFAESRKSDCSQADLCRFHALVQQRLARCRIEHGAPVGMYVSESMMTDLEQAALDLKHRLGDVDLKTTFKHLVELVSPHQKLISFTVPHSIGSTLAVECKVRDVSTIVARLYVELGDEVDSFSEPVLRFAHLPSKNTVGVAVRLLYRDPAVVGVLPTLKSKNGLSVRHVIDEQLQYVTIACIDKRPDAASNVMNLMRTLHQTGLYSADSIAAACEEQFPQTPTTRLQIDAILTEKVSTTTTRKWCSTLETICDGFRNTTCGGTARVRAIETLHDQSLDDESDDITSGFRRYSKVTMSYVRSTNQLKLPLMSELELAASAPVICKEIHVVNDALGIEAARSLLHEQLVALFAGAGVARRHITLLCDLLTLNGKPRGIRRIDAAADRTPLELAAFEEGRKAFTGAALRGWHGDEASVQHACVFNHPAQLGTGLITVDRTAAPVADDNQQATIWGHECDDSSVLQQRSCAPLGCNDLTIFQAFDS